MLRFHVCSVYDETKKINHESQIVRAKENPQVEPQLAKPKTIISHQLKFYARPSLSLSRAIKEETIAILVSTVT